MQKEREYDSFDLLKFICSLLIIFLHINPFSKEGEIYYLSRALANIGVPIFFILSGFFFFRIDGDVQEKQKKIKKYIKRLFNMLIFWMFPYFFVIDLWWIIDGNIVVNLLEYMHHILFGGPGFYLWYLVAQIVGITLCYALRKLNKKTSSIIVFSLLVVGVIGTSYTFLIKGTMIQTLYDFYIKYFATFRNGVFFGLPCIYIGMLIAENERRLPGLSSSAVFWGISILLMIVEFISIRIQNMSFSVMQISIIALSISSVLLFYNFDIRLGGILLRKLSFLIYVIYPLYIVLIPKLLNILKGIDYYWYLWYWWQIPVIVVTSIVTGLIIIWLSNHIRFLKKIM